MQRHLLIGDKAPYFSVQDVKNKQVKLSDQNNRYTLLVFLRYAGCPWCNLAIHRLILEYNLLQNNKCDVIAFVQSTKDNVIKNILERHAKKPKFPVIADPSLAIAHQYAVSATFKHSYTMIKNIPYWVHSVRKGGFKNKSIDGNLFFAPAAFLIAPKGRKILYANYSPNLYAHETFTKIYEIIATDSVVG